MTTSATRIDALREGIDEAPRKFRPARSKFAGQAVFAW